MPVRLSDVADALTASAGHRYLYSPEMDRIVSAKSLTPERQAHCLPIECDLDETDLMEAFLQSLPENDVPDALAWGGGSEGDPKELFRAAVFGTDLEQEWYDYRDRMYQEAARGWCREHGVHFIE
ncbi:MAG: hypothetical protein PHT00_00890 [Candidatus Methanomethylophilus sp.]|nr:hypothetical protein [Methanomethylophilus sp.]MDD4221518.1 hypothetical protein [Methanomethylophilus sp.]MDD4668349.1 hypothetical protein [Methanomethylophilus sp.]